MHLQALFLRDFRLYKDALFEFSPQMNVVCGCNARGKTSLLEAIYFLMTGRSFRTAQVSDLIRHGTSQFYLEANFVKYGIQQKLRVHYNGKERRISHNATTTSSSSALLGLLQGVVLHPDDAALVKGAPAARRHLLDLQIAQTDPVYIHHLVRYHKAMRQRNFLLRSRNCSTLDSWEHEMSRAAAYIIQQRASVTAELQEGGRGVYTGLCSGSEILSLTYKPHGCGEHPTADQEALRELFLDQYQRHRPREMDLGATLTGPHKDDLLISLADKEARLFASEGQQRSCVAALRLAEWKRLQTVSQETPLMLVDDWGMSLDQRRCKQMLEHFKGLGQVFMTATESKELLSDAHLIEL